MSLRYEPHPASLLRVTRFFSLCVSPLTLCELPRDYPLFYWWKTFRLVFVYLSCFQVPGALLTEGKLRSQLPFLREQIEFNQLDRDVLGVDKAIDGHTCAPEDVLFTTMTFKQLVFNTMGKWNWKYDMLQTCHRVSMTWKNAHKISVGKLEANLSLRRPCRLWENNIKDRVCVGADYIEMARATVQSRALVARYWSFEFYKRRRIYWAAEGISAYQLRLCFMDLEIVTMEFAVDRVSALRSGKPIVLCLWPATKE